MIVAAIIILLVIALIIAIYCAFFFRLMYAATMSMYWDRTGKLPEVEQVYERAKDILRNRTKK